MSPQILQYVDVATKVVQIIFWVIAGVVAVLTYRHARQTVLQPIRTEVFKAQLAAMSQIMGRFLGKNELELRDEFEFRRFFDVNAWALIDNYAMSAFGVSINPEDRPYSWKHCPIRMSPTQLRSTDPMFVGSKYAVRSPAPGAAGISGTWADYRTDVIYVNREFWTNQQGIGAFCENPLLPQQVVDLLNSYLGVAAENEIALMDLLDAAARQLPDRYPTLDSMQGASTAWIWDEYMKRFKHLRPVAAEIVDSIREYFDPDTLARGPSKLISASAANRSVNAPGLSRDQ